MTTDVQPLSENRENGLPVPGLEILGLMPLLGAALLALNDHYLKAACPSWMTGKLSDVAGMMFFPFLLSATVGWLAFGVRILSGRHPSREDVRLTVPCLTVCIVLSGLCLLLINVSPWWNEWYVKLIAMVTNSGSPAGIRSIMDPSDCLALAVLPVAWLWGKQWIDANR